MARMTPADAKEYLAEHDKNWQMPEEYWCVETVHMTFHVDEQTATHILRQDQEVIDPQNKAFAKFYDIYGASCRLRWEAVQCIFELTKEIRAKWVSGLDIRNYRDDPEPGDEPWQK